MSCMTFSCDHVPCLYTLSIIRGNTEERSPIYIESILCMTFSCDHVLCLYTLFLSLSNSVRYAMQGDAFGAVFCNTKPPPSTSNMSCAVIYNTKPPLLEFSTMRAAGRYIRCCVLRNKTTPYYE